MTKIQLSSRRDLVGSFDSFCYFHKIPTEGGQASCKHEILWIVWFCLIFPLGPIPTARRLLDDKAYLLFSSSRPMPLFVMSPMWNGQLPFLMERTSCLSQLCMKLSVSNLTSGKQEHQNWKSALSPCSNSSLEASAALIYYLQIYW